MTVPSEVRLERHTADIDDDGHHTGVAFSGDAVDVSIADAGSYFTATDVEAALQELASKDLGYTAHGALGSTETFSALVGAHSGTFSANCTFTFSGATSGLTASMILKLTSDGSSVPTWPGSVIWTGGSEPTLSTTPGEEDILVFFSWDGGTNWYGGLWGGGGGGTVTPDDVRDAGIWVRVTVPGSASPPDDVYSPDGTEWVYVWVAG